MNSKAHRPAIAQHQNKWSGKGRVEAVRGLVAGLSIAEVEAELSAGEQAAEGGDVRWGDTLRVMKVLLRVCDQGRGRDRKPYALQGNDAQRKTRGLVAFVADLLSQGHAARVSLDEILARAKAGDLSQEARDTVQAVFGIEPLEPVQCGALLYVDGLSTRQYQTLRNISPGVFCPLAKAVAATEPFAAPIAEVKAVEGLAGADEVLQAAAWSPQRAIVHALCVLGLFLDDAVDTITVVVQLSLDGYDQCANNLHKIGAALSIRKIVAGLKVKGRQPGQLLYRPECEASPFDFVDFLLVDGSDKDVEQMKRIAAWMESDLDPMRTGGIVLSVGRNGQFLTDAGAGRHRDVQVHVKVKWAADSLVVRSFFGLQGDGSNSVSPQRNTVRGRATDPRREPLWLWRVRPLMLIQGAIADALSGWGKGATGLAPSPGIARITGALETHRAAVEQEGDVYARLVADLAVLMDEVRRRWEEATEAQRAPHVLFNTVLTAYESEWLNSFRWGTARAPLIDADPRCDVTVDLLHRGLNASSKDINFARAIYEEARPLDDYPDEVLKAKGGKKPKRWHKKLYEVLHRLGMPMVKPQLEGNEVKRWQDPENVPQWMLALVDDDSKTVDDMQAEIEAARAHWEEHSSPEAMADLAKADDDALAAALAALRAK